MQTHVTCSAVKLQTTDWRSRRGLWENAPVQRSQAGCWASLINQHLQIGTGDSWEEVVPRRKPGLKNRIENGKQNNQMDGQTEKNQSQALRDQVATKLFSSAAMAGHSLEALWGWDLLSFLASYLSDIYLPCGQKPVDTSLL